MLLAYKVKADKMDRAWHKSERREMRTNQWYDNWNKKILLERPRLRRVDNIKLDLKRSRTRGYVAQDRDYRRALVNTVMIFLVPQNTGNFLTS
jgi:hypothetical protein